MNDDKLQKRVPVYLYRKPDGVKGRDWGTMTGIFALEGCEPITRSARLVDAETIGPDGFLPPGTTPE